MDAPTASRPAVNPLVADTGTPPIPEAQGWVERYGGAHGPLINMSQAVPGHPPHPDFMARLVEAAASVDAARYGPIAGDADLRAAMPAISRRSPAATSRPPTSPSRPAATWGSSPR
jgi:aspartate/methionine/tyrosine aminotransferase